MYVPGTSRIPLSRCFVTAETVCVRICQALLRQELEGLSLVSGGTCWIWRLMRGHDLSPDRCHTEAKRLLWEA